jgi:AcrR family transcriptional regulator
MTDETHDGLIAKLADQTLAQAGERGWHEVSLRDLCSGAGVPLSVTAQHMITRADVLTALHTRLDLEMLGATDEIDPDQNVRDHLFDVIMARFDSLEQNRKAWQSILSTSLLDPVEDMSRRARRMRTAAWALEAAGLDARSVQGAGRAIGLARILRLCEKVWLQDGPDLAKTMARLDQELRKGEAFVTRAHELAAFVSTFIAPAQRRRDPEGSVAD